MGKKIGTEKISREKGYLYYIGNDGHVWRSPLKGKPGRTDRVSSQAISKKKGGMYYLGKDGYVHEIG